MANDLVPIAPTPDHQQALAFCIELFRRAPLGGTVHVRGVPEPNDKRPAVNRHFALDAMFPENLRGFLEECRSERRAAYVLPGLVRPGGTKKGDVQSLTAVCIDF